MAASPGANGQTYATVTGPSGGYALAVADGTYSVSVRLPDRPGQFYLGTFHVAGSNRKIDVHADQALEEIPDFDRLDVNRDAMISNPGQFILGHYFRAISVSNRT